MRVRGGGVPARGARTAGRARTVRRRRTGSPAAVAALLPAPAATISSRGRVRYSRGALRGSASRAGRRRRGGGSLRRRAGGTGSARPVGGCVRSAIGGCLGRGSRRCRGVLALAVWSAVRGRRRRLRCPAAEQPREAAFTEPGEQGGGGAVVPSATGSRGAHASTPRSTSGPCRSAARPRSP
jgi:hypothetical protein